MHVPRRMDESTAHAFQSLKWWKRCKALPVQLSDAQSVSLGDKIYVGGDTEKLKDAAKVYIYTPSTDVWDSLNTPVYYFALATYLSKLVLVGGVEDIYDEYQWQSCTNKVWVLSEHDHDIWKNLPPMKINRQFACAVSHGHYLLVAGGESEESASTDAVEVYNGYHWSYAQPLPFQPFPDMKSAVVDGHWYLTCGYGQDKGISFVSLDILIDSSMAQGPSTVWQSFGLPDVRNISLCLGVFENHLIAVCQKGIPTSVIHAYSFDTHSWVYAGDLPLEMNSVSLLTLQTRELMIIKGMDNRFATNNVLVSSFFRGNVGKQLQVTEIDQPRFLMGVENSTLMEKLKTLETENNQLKHQLSQVLTERFKGHDSVEEKPLAHVPVNEEAVTVTKDKTTSPQPTAVWDLRGVEVCGEMTVKVRSFGAQQVTWKEYGLKLHIHEGSLPANVDQCTLTIKASLAGQYEFPENSYLVSAIFWIRCEPMCKLTKPVTVEMQHCARSENVANFKLKFVRAACSQKQLPYTFKELGGDFTSHSSYGIIEVYGFSGLAIAQEGSKDRSYLANLLSKEVIKSNPIRVLVEIFFVIIWNTNVHRTTMQGHDRFKDAHLVTDQPIAFELDQVEFQISNRSRNWKINKLNSPVVRKEDVDTFSMLSERSWIPHSHYKATYFGDSSVIHDLECAVDIIGARRPHNTLTIDISPEGPIPGGPQLTGPGVSPLHSSDHVATRLSCHHLSPVLQQLCEHAAKWRDIGGALGFTQGELDTIQAKPFLLAGGPKSWLGSMLSDWLQWAPGDGRGSTHFATLETLKYALQQVNLGATAHTLHINI